MKESQFVSYFSIVYILLLLVGNIMTLFLWKKLGMNGAVAGLLITSIIAGFIFTAFTKVKIVDKNGKSKEISDIIGSVLSILVVIISASLLITIAAAVIAYRKDRHLTSIAIPLLVLFVVLGMMYLCAVH